MKFLLWFARRAFLASAICFTIVAGAGYMHGNLIQVGAFTLVAVGMWACLALTFELEDKP